jgi:NAD+--dinitrogen-reductase ADP-D-ribosyltransferase
LCHNRRPIYPPSGRFVSEPATAIPSFGHRSNLVGVPTALIADPAFNADPQPLAIAGARALNPKLFEMLSEADGPADAALAFETYMAAVFGLDPEMREKTDREGRRRYRSSYFRLLRGWGYDSNGPEGAVLKGWVESRFGLVPTFHKAVLGRYPSPAWMGYVEEKMGSRFHNNAILSQLDLLYEFCQWARARYFAAEPLLTLYRGVNDFAEHPILERRDRRRVVLHLNSLVSFTTDRDIAGCFGDTILEVRVPAVKVLFYSSLLPRHGLKGEDEVLALGGAYDVRATTF